MRHLSKFLPLKCSLIHKVHLRSLFAFLGWHVEGVYVCVHLCVHVLPQKRSFFFSQVEGCTEFVAVKNLVFICHFEFAPLPTVGKVLIPQSIATFGG